MISLCLLCRILLALRAIQETLAYNVSMGEAIKGRGNAVYLLKDGVKHHVTNWGYFLSLGYTVEDIHTYSDNIVNSYTTGDPISPPPSPPSPPVRVVDPILGPCPCRPSMHHSIVNEDTFLSLTSQIYTVCIVRNPASEHLFGSIHKESITLNYQLISEEDSRGLLRQSTQNSNSSSEYQCNVIIRFSFNHTRNETAKLERRCPGICKPYPFIEVPISAFSIPFDIQQTLTCTMTLSAVFSHTSHGSHHNSNISSTTRAVDTLLHAISRRRIEECIERGIWPLGSFSKHNSSGVHSTDSHSLRHVKWSNSSYLLPHRSRFPRRKVYGLIIWIGSNSRLSMLLAQTEVLRLQEGSMANDSQRIFGWVATEDQYPCPTSFPGCKSQYAYHWMMPSTKMAYEGKTGWGCAQRRPLRALSHALLLFEPEFLLIVDDDTYVNLNLLLYGSILSGVLLKDEVRLGNIAMGHLTGGNKITRNGFFYGGAGYLLTKGLLEKLVSYKLVGPSGSADGYRDNKHYNHLGMMEEALPPSKKWCPDDCVRLAADSPPNEPHFVGNKADLKVRKESCL